MGATAKISGNFQVSDMQDLPRYADRRFESKSRGKVRQYSYTSALPSLKVQADCIIFINRGQNYCIIDEMFVLAPGGTLKERNVINDYQIRFYNNSTPPTADGVLVKSGNYVAVRMLNGDGDVDCDIVIENPASFATGDITVEVTPATAVSDTPIGELTLDTTINIPAGKTKVVVINKGSSVPVGGTFGNDASATATAGSLNAEIPVDPMSDGFLLTASGFNAATNTYGTLPAVTIDNSGGAAIDWYAI